MQVLSGIQKQNKLILLYGIAGVGKTTLASLIDGALFLDLEHGSLNLNVDRITQVKDYKEFYKWFVDSQYSTLVIDSWSKFEQQLIEQILKEYKKESLESFGYGKGYEILKQKIAEHIKAFEYIAREKCKNIVVIAHSRIRTASDPMNEAYDRYEPDVVKQALPFIAASFDYIFFMRHNTYVKDKEGRKAISSGDRELYTREQPAFLAKSRTRLDELIENPTKELWENVL